MPLVQLLLATTVALNLPVYANATPTHSRSARAFVVRSSFQSVGQDRRAIQALLETYAKAVISKDEALFETLLLNKTISFSDVESAIRRGSDDGGTHNYEAFRQGVFGGAPFRQAFKNIKILQDGPLVQVSLELVNTAAKGRSLGWKTLQLLKIRGQWKIASEFYVCDGPRVCNPHSVSRYQCHVVGKNSNRPFSGTTLITNSGLSFIIGIVWDVVKTSGQPSPFAVHPQRRDCPHASVLVIATKRR